jgi:hypothetical protein
MNRSHALWNFPNFAIDLTIVYRAAFPTLS